MSLNSPENNEITLPTASIMWIGLSLLISLLLNLLPYKGTVQIIHPDFVALVLMYWSLYQPKRVGLFLVLVLGLLMDVGSGDILGQHALVYTIALFPILVWQRRLSIYSWIQQLFYLIPTFCVMQVLLLIIKLMIGNPWIGWQALFPIVTNTVAMPLIWYLLGLPLKSQPKKKKD